ncbi:MAG: hypothetical protein ACXIVL_08935 [Oceanicaulis sp.]
MSAHPPSASPALVRKLTYAHAALGLCAIAGFQAAHGPERLIFAGVLVTGLTALIVAGFLVREVGGRAPFSVVPGWPDRVLRLAAFVCVFGFGVVSYLGLEYRPPAA